MGGLPGLGGGIWGWCGLRSAEWRRTCGKRNKVFRCGGVVWGVGSCVWVKGCGVYGVIVVWTFGVLGLYWCLRVSSFLPGVREDAVPHDLDRSRGLLPPHSVFCHARVFSLHSRLYTQLCPVSSIHCSWLSSLTHLVIQLYVLDSEVLAAVGDGHPGGDDEDDGHNDGDGDLLLPVTRRLLFHQDREG